MLRSLALLGLLAAFAPTSHCAVEELGAWTLDAFLDARPSTPVILEFYAPWCAHCAAYAPHYARAAEQGGALAAWARVDGSAHYSLALRFSVLGFPTLFYLGAAAAAGGEGGSAREVRRLGLTSQSHEGVLEYARGGWRLQALEGSGWRGPWGPLALAKFHAARAYEVAYGALAAPAAALEIPPVVVQFTLILLLLCALTSTVVACAVWCGSARRAARRRPLQPAPASSSSSAASKRD